MTGISRNFDEPDEVVELAGATEELITMGGLTLSRSTQSVGWRWSEHFKHLVGGELCQARHMGYVLSGILGVQLEDGTSMRSAQVSCMTSRRVTTATVGDEPFVSIEWSGMRTWVGRSAGNRVQATLLFTDVVDSTGMASRLGDAAWHDLLSMHFHTCDDALAHFGGRRVTTTGDGILATFDATRTPCAARSPSVRWHNARVLDPRGRARRRGRSRG